ncbi:hypothetical protein GQ457_14G024290 [Hibiscus cannabinus]
MGDASKRIKRENVDAGSKQISADEKPKIADGSSVIHNTNTTRFSIVKSQKLPVIKKEVEEHATNAEQRVTELEKLLKAKEDECAKLKDLLVNVKRKLSETCKAMMEP